MVFSIRWLNLPIFIDSRPLWGTKKPIKCADRQISSYLIKMMKTDQKPRTLDFTSYPIESKVRSLSHSAMTCSRGIYCKVKTNRSILLRLLNFQHNKPSKNTENFFNYISFYTAEIVLFKVTLQYRNWNIFYGLVIN